MLGSASAETFKQIDLGLFEDNKLKHKRSKQNLKLKIKPAQITNIKSLSKLKIKPKRKNSQVSSINK